MFQLMDSDHFQKYMSNFTSLDQLRVSLFKLGDFHFIKWTNVTGRQTDRPEKGKQTDRQIWYGDKGEHHASGLL